MRIRVNGELRELDEALSVGRLLEDLKLLPDKVAVELNRKLLRGNAYDRPLSEGDEIEIVTFVGGGC